MPSLHPGFEYDIFISYRQNDNRSGWVRQFVEDLREELGATLKDPVNIYYDENPHDGLQDTHLVDESLKGKLRCLIFIPILSRTYCDPKGFAWNHEFLPFCRMSGEDSLGRVVRLGNGNAASRILPILIHDIDPRDKQLFEQKTGSVLRPVEFVFRSSGINRPLTGSDSRTENLSKTLYRDQINKAANALSDLIHGITNPDVETLPPQTNLEPNDKASQRPKSSRGILMEIGRRNVLRAGIVYIATSLLVYLLVKNYASFPEKFIPLLGLLMVVGLVLAITLAWLFERSPEGWIRTNSPESATNPYAAHQRKPLTSLWVVAPMMVLIAYIVFKDSKDTPVRIDKSIAVLPFTDRSDSTGSSYLGDGFTEDLVNKLYRVGELRVISPVATRTYKDTKKSTKEIAEELDVSALLTGSIWRSPSELKVNVQLTNGETSEVLWIKAYQKKGADIFIIQSEIAREVAGVLKVKLDELVEARMNQRPTMNLTAYDHYLRGRKLYTYSNADSMDLAIREFNYAITLDPGYSLAYASLADSYGQLYQRFARGSRWLDSALLSASKAIQLDTSLSDGYKAMGAAFNYARRYDTALYYHRKAVEKNPNNYQAISNLGSAYFIRNEYAEALRLYKESARLHPRNAVTYQAVGWTYRLLGMMREAEVWLLNSLERNPGLWDAYRELGFVYCLRGQPEKALQLIPKMMESGDRTTRRLEIAGRIAHFAGDSQQAKQFFLEAIEQNNTYQTDANSVSPIALGQILKEEGNSIESDLYLQHALKLNMAEIQKGSQDDDPPINVAAIQAILGKRAEALAFLQKAIDANWVDYAQFEKGPYFAAFRSDPDFIAKVSGVKEKMEALRKAVEP